MKPLSQKEILDLLESGEEIRFKKEPKKMKKDEPRTWKAYRTTQYKENKDENV